jgi:GntR family transcriptional regulator/MocR family aminotransferase
MKRVAGAVAPIIEINKKAPPALYSQVYDAYRKAIVDGSLRPGQRVPSTRVLASELGISRIPVLNAYAQLLAEGYFQSRVGAGTVVSKSLPDQAPVLEPNRAPASNVNPRLRPVSRRGSSWSLSNLRVERGYGAFNISQISFEHFPLSTWNSLVTRHCRMTSGRSLDYGDPMGLSDLREAVADYLRTARGVRCEAGQIIIVSGSQQGLEVAVRVLLNPGDRVWIEEPGYRFARSIFALQGCETVPVPVDYEGLNVKLGITLCRKARAAFVTPSHQNPLGVTMSAGRRLQLLDWAESSGSWIIEDDYDSEYRYESMPIASLQGLDRNSRVVYIGTFSKVLFPALRLGYIVIPWDLVERSRSVRFAMDISPPTFFQAVLADFIREGHFARHIRRMRLVYAERRRVLIDNIREQLGFSADITGGQAGMHLTVTLKGIRDNEIAQQALRENLWLAPLSAFYTAKPVRQGFVLGYGSTVPEKIPAAVKKLRNLLATA